MRYASINCKSAKFLNSRTEKYIGIICIVLKKILLLTFIYGYYLSDVFKINNTFFFVIANSGKLINRSEYF